MRIPSASSFVAALVVASTPVLAQQQPGPRTDTAVAKVVVEPASFNLKAGETAPLKVTAYDSAGNELKAERIRVSGPRGAVMVNDSSVKALRAGRYEIVATAGGRSNSVVTRVPIAITWPDAVVVS